MAMRDSQVDSPDFAPEAVEMSKGADIGFLHHILGFAVVAQDAAREAVKPAVVGLHDLAERGLVTASRAIDQLGFRCPCFQGLCAGGQAGCGPVHGDHLLVFVSSRHWMQAGRKGSRLFSP